MREELKQGRPSNSTSKKRLQNGFLLLPFSIQIQSHEELPIEESGESQPNGFSTPTFPPFSPIAGILHFSFRRTDPKDLFVYIEICTD